MAKNFIDGKTDEDWALANETNQEHENEDDPANDRQSI